MTGDLLIAVAAALAAAGCFALSSVLQHHSATQVPRTVHPRLLRNLFARPVWLAGIAADGIGMVLHAFALSGVALAIIQPLSVCTLLFALPISRAVTGRRIRGSEYGWTAVVVAGLAGFLLAARPTAGRLVAPGLPLAAGSGAAVALIALTVAIARRPARRRPALLLGLATGVAFGVVSALTKQVTGLVLLGLPAVVDSWPPYALAVIGPVSLGLSQYAYQAGPLSASLPSMTILDPVVATVLGVLAFGERFAGGPGELAVAAVAFAAMAAGVVPLASSHPAGGPDGPIRRSGPQRR